MGSAMLTLREGDAGLGLGVRAGVRVGFRVKVRGWE